MMLPANPAAGFKKRVIPIKYKGDAKTVTKYVKPTSQLTPWSCGEDELFAAIIDNIPQWNSTDFENPSKKPKLQ